MSPHGRKPVIREQARQLRQRRRIERLLALVLISIVFNRHRVGIEWDVLGNDGSGADHRVLRFAGTLRVARFVGSVDPRDVWLANAAAARSLTLPTGRCLTLRTLDSKHRMKGIGNPTHSSHVAAVVTESRWCLIGLILPGPTTTIGHGPLDGSSSALWRAGSSHEQPIAATSPQLGHS